MIWDGGRSGVTEGVETATLKEEEGEEEEVVV